MIEYNIGDLPQRVHSRIAIQPTGCWNWLGAKTTRGYGEAFHSSTVEYAHRYTYRLLVGPIGKGLQIDHLCRNVSCCNPAHPEPVTLAENRRRAGEALTECKRGHPFTPENTRRSTRGARVCIACRKLYKQCERRNISARTV